MMFRVQQDGGDEERERQIGLDLELGARGNEGQRRTGDREERGIGDPDTPGETGQDHRSEKKRQSPFEDGHVRKSRTYTRTWGSGRASVVWSRRGRHWSGA